MTDLWYAVGWPKTAMPVPYQYAPGDGAIRVPVPDFPEWDDRVPGDCGPVAVAALSGISYAQAVDECRQAGFSGGMTLPQAWSVIKRHRQCGNLTRYSVGWDDVGALVDNTLRKWLLAHQSYTGLVHVVSVEEMSGHLMAVINGWVFNGESAYDSWQVDGSGKVLDWQKVKRAVEAAGQFLRIRDEPYWIQEQSELVADAMHSWKGSPTEMNIHMYDEIHDVAHVPSSGSGKIMRAQAKALLIELRTNGRPIPKLYRGGDRMPQGVQGWSENLRTANRFAKMANGTVYALDAGSTTGLCIRDYHGLGGLDQDEREWIVDVPAGLARTFYKSQAKVAAKTYRFYHGTTTRALDAIRSAGEIRTFKPSQIAADIEREYHLPPGSVLNEPGFYFSRDRENDPLIYLSGEYDTAHSYAGGGSEIISDALSSAWFLLNPSEDPRGRDITDPISKQREPWVREQMRKFHGDSVVLTLDLPADFVWDHLDEREKRHFVTMDKMVEVLDQYGAGTTWTAVAPIPARYITMTKMAASESERRLKEIAQFFPVFGDFEKAFQNGLTGRYWHITNDPNFTIRGTTTDVTIGETDGFFCTPLPDQWRYYAKTRPWCVEVVLRGRPGLEDGEGDYWEGVPGDGRQVFVPDPVRTVEVVKVTSYEAASAAARRYWATLPDTAEGLARLWMSMWPEAEIPKDYYGKPLVTVALFTQV